MPDLATLIGYPSGQAPSTDSRQRADGAGSGAWGAGAGGGGGGAAAGIGAGAGAAEGISLRRCSAVQTANAAPLITASRNSRFSQVVIVKTVVRPT